jgi:hypothetical protein
MQRISSKHLLTRSQLQKIANRALQLLYQIILKYRSARERMYLCSMYVAPYAQEMSSYAQGVTFSQRIQPHVQLTLTTLSVYLLSGVVDRCNVAQTRGALASQSF